MSSPLSDEKYHFVTLCRYFLDALNPRPEDYVVCLDCILSVPEVTLTYFKRSEYRDKAYQFVGYFYGHPTVTDAFKNSHLGAYVQLFKWPGDP